MTPSTPASPSPSTRVIPAAEVLAAFASGGSFIETPEYRVALARREGSGPAEVHEIDTDIFHVLAGAATLLTGGEMVEPRTVSDGEIRASRTRGGQSASVSKGDLIIIPRGVPHWFEEVTEAPFVYLVVKSTSARVAEV